jgi:hypothetical protein
MPNKLPREIARGVFWIGDCLAQRHKDKIYHSSEELPMQTVSTIGFDIAKSVFQVHGVNANGLVVIRRQLKRRYVLAFFEKLPSGSNAQQEMA